MRLFSNIITGLDQVFSGNSTKRYLPGITWFFVILILVMIPGRNIPSTGSWFELLMVDKWVHAFMFAVLTYMFIRPLRFTGNTRFSSAVVIMISLYALGTEFIQHHFVPGRNFDAWDWVADNVGIIIGLYINKKTPLPLK